MRRHCITSIAGLTYWLTPQVWKEAHQAQGGKRSTPRWKLHPLLTVLLLMTWTTGDSEAERFATARAAYVARHQHGRRPGQTLSGFQQAWPSSPCRSCTPCWAASEWFCSKSSTAFGAATAF